jgi:hypothetical protein
LAQLHIAAPMKELWLRTEMALATATLTAATEPAAKAPPAMLTAEATAVARPDEHEVLVRAL